MLRYRIPIALTAAFVGITALAGCGPSADTSTPAAAKPSTGAGATDTTTATPDKPSSGGQSMAPQKAPIDPSK